jgi:excisionase family DNA binding protein
VSETGALDATIRSIVRDVVRDEIRAALDERASASARNRSRNGNGSEDRYLSISRAATLADVAPGTLRRWIKEGQIPTRRAGRVYRVSRDDLETFLRSGRSADIVGRARAILDDDD